MLPSVRLISIQSRSRAAECLTTRTASSKLLTSHDQWLYNQRDVFLTSASSGRALVAQGRGIIALGLSTSFSRMNRVFRVAGRRVGLLCSVLQARGCATEFARVLAKLERHCGSSNPNLQNFEHKEDNRMKSDDLSTVLKAASVVGLLITSTASAQMTPERARALGARLQQF